MVIARVGADVEGSVCGFAIVRTILDEAELLLIATDPARQRLGVGTTLLNAVVQMTEERSVSRLYVEVRHDNPALDFYYGHHFVKIGERLNYYRRSDGQVGHALTLVRKVPV